MIYFKKEQFIARLCFLISSLIKQFLYFSQIPPVYIYPNVIRIFMRCGVLDALYQLILYLLEILFVYTIKMSPNKQFSLSAHIPSIQFVIDLPDSNKDWAKGHVLVFSPLSCSTVGLDQLFKSKRFLELPSTVSIFICCFIIIALNGQLMFSLYRQRKTLLPS